MAPCPRAPPTCWSRCWLPVPPPLSINSRPLSAKTPRTTFRYLRRVLYLRSHNHNGRFYTNRDTTCFDRFGLLSIGDVHFSRDRSLTASVERLSVDNEAVKGPSVGIQPRVQESGAGRRQDRSNAWRSCAACKLGQVQAAIGSPFPRWLVSRSQRTRVSCAMAARVARPRMRLPRRAQSLGGRVGRTVPRGFRSAAQLHPNLSD